MLKKLRPVLGTWWALPRGEIQGRRHGKSRLGGWIGWMDWMDGLDGWIGWMVVCHQLLDLGDGLPYLWLHLFYVWIFLAIFRYFWAFLVGGYNW